MIIDTDTHSIPLEIFSHPALQTDLGKKYAKRAIAICIGHADPNERWEKMYNDVKDPSWPDCKKVEDFPNLPLTIRKELKENFEFELVYISDDYTQLHVEHLGLEATNLQHQELSGRHFCKVDKQVINAQSRGMKMIYSTEPELAIQIMTAWNDTLHDLCQKNSFYDYTLWLAMQDINASFEELKRCKDRDFFAVWMDDRMPYAWVKELHPIFEFCNDYKIPIYFHRASIDDAPLQWTWDYDHPRFIEQKKTWPFDIFVENNVRWTSNIASLITEGILDKYPDLRLVVAEKGLEWMHFMRKTMLQHKWKDPLPYIRKNFWFTTEPEDENFLETASFIGWDKMLFATDYAHNDPGGNNRFKDVDLLNEWLSKGTITQEQYDLITHKNYFFLKARK